MLSCLTMLPILETPRLELRPLELSDAVQVQAIFPQWEVVRLLNAKVPWPFPSDGVFLYYRDDAMPAMAAGDEWHWTLRLKGDPSKIIGAIGLFRKGEDNRGFWIVPSLRRLGLMTEAVIAITDFWFDTLGFETLFAPKAAANEASRRVSEKTGMVIVSTCERDYVSGRLPTEIWKTTKARWHAYREQALQVDNSQSPSRSHPSIG
jgi:ribosomal-protein-alanine N-acetyltransferase